MTRSLFVAALALPLLAAESQKQSAPQPSMTEMGFDSAYIVFLRRPDKAKQYDEAKLQEIQKAHLTHLGDLYKAGRIDVAGPFDDQDDTAMRGLAIYPAGLGKDEVRRLAEDDPAVKAGRLKVEIVRWYFQKGALTFPHPGLSAPVPK
jgi:uncharacterized protein YciI